MAALNLVIAMNPLAWFIGIVLAGVVALGYLIYKIIENWETIKKFFWALGVIVGGIFVDIGSAIMDAFGAAGDFVMGVIDKIGGALKWVGRQLGIVSSDTEGAISRVENARNRAGGGVALGPVANGADRPFTYAQANREQTAKVVVDFTNAPKGTRVTKDPRSTADINTNMGYNMMLGGAI